MESQDICTIQIKDNTCYLNGIRIEGLKTYSVEKRINCWIFHGEFQNKRGIIFIHGHLPSCAFDLQETWLSDKNVKSKISCYITEEAAKSLGE